MFISNQLEKIGIDCRFVNEKEVDSLGLAVAVTDATIATFIENVKYAENLNKNIKVLITTESVYEEFEHKESYGFCIVESPRLAFFKLHNSLKDNDIYRRPRFKTEIDSFCDISEKASISKENVRIGKNVVIEDFVVIRDNVTIGDNSVIRAGSIIGGEGFEFKNDAGHVFGIKHLGGVVIGANVEVQYNSCIDKAIYPWDDTILSDETKIDNFVHVGHAVKIGKGTMVAANATIGGRVEIGEYSWLGISSTVRNGITIGSRSRVNMGAVTTKSVPDNCAVSGNFAIEHNSFIDFIKKI